MNDIKRKTRTTIIYKRGHGKDAKRYYLDNVEYYKNMVRSMKTWRAFALLAVVIIVILAMRGI